MKVVVAMIMILVILVLTLDLDLDGVLVIQVEQVLLVMLNGVMDHNQLTLYLHIFG